MRLALTVLALAAAAIVPLPADALELDAQPGARQARFEGEPLLRVVQQNGMSLSEAIESVRRRTGGRIVSAETKVQGGREVHYIKVLTKDGKVRTHKVNGRRR